ncbi:SGNH/GDSL hydrolase family protein [bacterium]|nr:SGNH/GDSL hydrolase family protein [bacterium]
MPIRPIPWYAHNLVRNTTRIRFAGIVVIAILVSLEALLRVSGIARANVDKVYSDIYDIEYVMLPGTVYPYSKDGEHLNEHGFRGKPLPRERTPGLRRVICMGDSTTAGYGPLEDSYPYRLQVELEKDFGEGRVEVFNAGLPGTCLLQQLLLFQRLLRKWRPDVLVVGGQGDGRRDVYLYRRELERERFKRLYTARRYLAKSEIYRTMRRLIKGPPVGLVLDPMNAGSDTFTNYHAQMDLWADLERFDAMGREDGFKLIFFHPPDRSQIEALRAQGLQPGTPGYRASTYRGIPEQFARRHGHPFVDVIPGFLAEPMNQELFYDPVHPGGRGNRVLARQIANVVREKLADAVVAD